MRTIQWDYAKNTRPTRDIKQEWERLYRAAVLESDRNRMPQRIEEARAAILDRSRRLPDSADSGREQGAITRALHILSLLHEAELGS